LLGLVVAVVAVVVAVMALPFAREAVNDLGLPLDYQGVIRGRRRPARWA
jgi:hypothetical protein